MQSDDRLPIWTGAGPGVPGPGPRNAITDVPGLTVGQAQDDHAETGVTVLLPDAPAVAAVDVRGGGPGTRETDLLRPGTLVERVDALFLSGGSAFGLEAGAGVMRWLARHNRGYPAGGARIPIVPGAILFDAVSPDRQPWAYGQGGDPPFRDLAIRACETAGRDIAQGSYGAGSGAVAGGLKGGIGTASSDLGGGMVIGAIAAVNPFGSVVMGDSGLPWAWPFLRGEDIPGVTRFEVCPEGPINNSTGTKAERMRTVGVARENTTIAIVATNADLAPDEAERIAVSAQDGLARAIRPAHTLVDGDIVFVIATGRVGLGAGAIRRAALMAIGAEAADTLARAIFRGVFFATGTPTAPAYRDRFSIRAEPRI